MTTDHIAGLLAGVLGSGLVFFVLWRKIVRRRVAEIRKALEVEAREERLAAREDQSRAEMEFERRRSESERTLSGREAELKAGENELQRSRARLEEERSSVDARSAALEHAEHEAEKLRRLYRMKLHQLTHLDETDAKRVVLEGVRRDCDREIKHLRDTRLGRALAEVDDEARRVLLASMQRIAGQPMQDATATLVPLASEDFKGRIIGREGRNIRTFEHATGTTLMIDETPDSVLISCFDPVRREIARIALEALLRDGRIHPSSIEEQVRKAEEEMANSVIAFGEEALRKLRLHDVHPEVVSLLGRLHYRLSNNQNTLAHSVEVAQLCSLVAAEIGLDTTLAKRAGLFHDIGKALGEEFEGSHAVAGANVLKQHGEDPRVVNAVAAHHEEVDPASAFAPLVMVADSLSAIRPGARTASIDGFIQRVRSIEEIARAERGVVDAYAIQAGRELRVIVEPGSVGEEAAREVARHLRDRIETELQYPGTIRITVIREQRFTETAV